MREQMYTDGIRTFYVALVSTGRFWIVYRQPEKTKMYGYKDGMTPHRKLQCEENVGWDDQADAEQQLKWLAEDLKWGKA